MLTGIDKRSVGINPNKNAPTAIKIWAPQAQSVNIVTASKSIQLENTGHGFWEGASMLLTEGSRYKIQIDGAAPLPDPASLSQPDGVHEASAVVDLQSFAWKAKNWKNLPLEDYIIYELHVGTFTREGTFAAIESKLDHLAALGITAVEIMPVAQFPGDRNWGYDGVYPFAVQESYGGAKGLQSLVDACHQKGIAVILDVVYNHLGPEGNYFSNYGSFFTNKYKTPWGEAINFDDAWCDGVRQFYIENALMWLRDFHIDALRLDAVHAIKDFSAVHILQEIRQHVDELMKQTGRQHYLFVESDLNDPKFINPLNSGGYGADAQWMDEFHHALRVTSGQATTGYYADFSGIEHLAKSYRDAYVYDGQYSNHRKRRFGSKAENEGKQFIVFSQNHDQVGNRMLGERTSSLVSFEMQKLLAAAVMVTPFLPLLFMGEEWSETAPFLYFVSHADKDLCEAVRKGRKEEFSAFHASGEAPDPNAEESFLTSKLHWHLKDKGQHRVMVDYYKALITLRKINGVLKGAERKNLAVTPDKSENTLALHRWQGNNEIYCLMNFSKETRRMNIAHQKDWQPLLDSAAPKWGGPRESDIQEDFLLLQPESICILGKNEPT